MSVLHGLFPLVALLFFLHYGVSQRASGATVGSTDSRCSVLNGIVADRNNCSSFLVCLRGRVRRVVTCSRGLLYDTTIRMCNHRASVDCGERLTEAQASGSDCVLRDIGLTLRVDNSVQRPFFSLQINIRAPRQPLENFLLMAAGRDDRFRFESEPFDNFGMFVTSINNVRANSNSLTTWVPSDRFGQEINTNIKDYLPEDRDTITFNLLSFSSLTRSRGCQGANCRAVNSRLLRG